MQDEIENVKRKQIANSKVADSGGKIIFENPYLCAQLFQDYVDMEELKGIRPEDIKDVTERYIPMFTEERDADVVKKIHLKDNNDIFIALIEHKSSVDYNVVMQILRYMVYIWEDYANQQDSIQKGISATKSFKYPPVLPIVYYEGNEEWTAAQMLSDKIALSEAFGEFIPNFKYYLIQLKDYDKETLISHGNSLSLVMLINSIKSAEEFKTLQLPEGYLDSLFENSPGNVLRVISRVIAVVLRKQNVPENEIRNLVDQIERKKHMALFDDWEGFDVQEERRNGEEIKLIKQVCKKMQKGQAVEKIAEDLMEDEEYIQQIYDTTLKFAPDYDVETIFEALPKKELVKEG